MGIRIIQSDAPLGDPAVAAVRDKLRAGKLTAGAGELDVPKIVREIIADVAKRGDGSVVELTARLDKVALTPEKLRVTESEIKSAHKAAAPAFLELIRRAAANIRQYQQSVFIKEPPPLKRGGRRLALRYTPIDRVGVYVPGGRALYPSTVLMTVVPAQVAGVKEIALASPPTTDGDIHPMLLALAGELGVSEVYRVGGAQAIAALAFGTATIRAVQKIVGPGNAFVAEAKRQVFGRVGIDSIAGPSEVLIVADDTARADWLAADMLAQAEHDPGSAVLVTPSKKLAEAVAAEIEKQLPGLSRAEAARQAIEVYGLIVIVKDIDAACDVANDFAAEHLQIITADDQAALAEIRNAGAIFLGPYTPAVLGDYYAGPSHVLPTGGT
ncbi:MAG: histidinol dehydrogenase, partial [Phycisphaerae bacterium]|nr:histidinol dehydrogenase [Phycisphaerae bacterium]